jgi:hypothetical protein
MVIRTNEKDSTREGKFAAFVMRQKAAGIMQK